MEMKYYNASNNFSAPIKREPKPYRPYSNHSEMIVPEIPREELVIEKPAPKKTEPLTSPKKQNNFLGNLEMDDLILLGLIWILIMDSSDDIMLLLILGFLFFSGKQNKEG